MTPIQWTDQTWNPVTGCDRTSPGCDHCYALTMAARLKRMGNPRYQVDGDERTSGPGFGLTLHHDKLNEPYGWMKPRRVFVNSMSDLFHADVPDEFICSVFSTMARCARHTFQVLTKRPQRMATLLDRVCWDDVTYPNGLFKGACDLSKATAYLSGSQGEEPLDNVWLGTSIENDRYTFRANHLRETPAAIRFLSLEPLLGPVPSLDLTDIDWVIIGGESGPGARPMELGWVEEIMAKAVESPARPQVFVKQLGSVLARELGAGGKGGKPEEWPYWLRVRDWPKAAA